MKVEDNTMLVTLKTLEKISFIAAEIEFSRQKIRESEILKITFFLISLLIFGAKIQISKKMEKKLINNQK